MFLPISFIYYKVQDKKETMYENIVSYYHIIYDFLYVFIINISLIINSFIKDFNDILLIQSFKSNISYPLYAKYLINMSDTSIFLLSSIFSEIFFTIPNIIFI